MILVTGCTGYIGFHICEFLELKRLPYFGIDNFSRSHSKNIINKKKFLKIKNFHIFHANKVIVN